MPELEAKFAERRGPQDPATFQEYMDSRGPEEFERWALTVAPTLIDHAWIGGLLNNMRWFVREITTDAGEFLTCDRPALMIDELEAPDSFVPKRLFVAVHNVETQRRIEARSPNEHVWAVNWLIAGRANDYVYARDDSLVDFVREYFGTRRRKSLFERLIEFRRKKNQENTAAMVEKP